MISVTNCTWPSWVMTMAYTFSLLGRDCNPRWGHTIKGWWCCWWSQELYTNSHKGHTHVAQRTGWPTFRTEGRTVGRCTWLKTSSCWRSSWWPAGRWTGTPGNYSSGMIIICQSIVLFSEVNTSTGLHEIFTLQAVEFRNDLSAFNVVPM